MTSSSTPDATEPSHSVAVARPLRSPSRLGTSLERMLTAMADWPAPLLFGGFLAWFIGWSVLASVLVERLVDEGDQAALALAAGDLVPAIGVLFSFLTGFVISSQWSRSRSAEGLAGTEADAAVQLCLASQSPGIDGETIRHRLAAYLDLVVSADWHTLVHHSGRSHIGDRRTSDALDALERTARVEATAGDVSTAIAHDVLRAAEGIAVARRDRLNLSGHGLPAPLFILVFIAGVVLSLDAIVLSVGLDGLSGLMVGGLVVLIALDLALIVAISDPFRGPMRALPTPITVVRDDLRRGRFGPLGLDDPSTT